MSKIFLNDLLNFSDDDYTKVKVRFNQFNGEINPMDEYQANPNIVDTQWLFWRSTQRFFSVGQIAVCFLKLADDTWLLTTIKRVTKELDIINGVNYNGEILEEYKRYFGRVVIKFHKDFQAQGRYYDTICDKLEVLQILPNVFDGDDFPGYDKVRLTFNKLQAIISRGKKDWIAALENQKAVYLITDTSNGKMYVGSATADTGMLLQRWKNYVTDGHGGNKELKALVSKNGFEYVKSNFQYSILENYNAKVDDHIIFKRETWWKETLCSRKFGYNKN